jgi:hypothetical protein
MRWHHEQEDKRYVLIGEYTSRFGDCMPDQDIPVIDVLGCTIIYRNYGISR